MAKPKTPRRGSMPEVYSKYMLEVIDLRQALGAKVDYRWMTDLKEVRAYLEEHKGTGFRIRKFKLGYKLMRDQVI